MTSFTHVFLTFIQLFYIAENVLTIATYIFTAMLSPQPSIHDLITTALSPWYHIHKLVMASFLQPWFHGFISSTFSPWSHLHYLVSMVLSPQPCFHALICTILSPLSHLCNLVSMVLFDNILCEALLGISHFTVTPWKSSYYVAVLIGALVYAVDIAIIYGIIDRAETVFKCLKMNASQLVSR